MDTTYYARTLIFGHRGASANAPENTLAALRLARQMGADGVEFDVQLSRDREVIICHDVTVDRTTNGHGAVGEFTLAELKELDAGSWFGPSFAGERIPTLQEAIDFLDKDALMNIELKSDALLPSELEARVAGIIRHNALHARVIVSSFNPLCLYRLHRIDPAIDLGLLYCPDMPFYLRRPWARYFIPLHALHPEHIMVDEHYMQWARAQGYRVNVWTVDELAEKQRLASLGVSIIITNKPEVLAQDH